MVCLGQWASMSSRQPHRETENCNSATGGQLDDSSLIDREEVVGDWRPPPSPPDSRETSEREGLWFQTFTPKTT